MNSSGVGNHVLHDFKTQDRQQSKSNIWDASVAYQSVLNEKVHRRNKHKITLIGGVHEKKEEDCRYRQQLIQEKDG